jgi:hypothetical protein
MGHIQRKGRGRATYYQLKEEQQIYAATLTTIRSKILKPFYESFTTSNTATTIYITLVSVETLKMA